MTLSLGDRKLMLIQEIMNLNNEQSLAQIEQKVLAVRKSVSSKEKFWPAIKSVKKSDTIAAMIARQGYVPLEKSIFYDKVSKIAIEEPLEELLSMLNK